MGFDAPAERRLSPPESGREPLLNELYNIMRSIASREMSRERSDHTLQATALVHEAYLRLEGSAALAAMPAGEVCALATTVIRNVLIDHARTKAAQRRGAGARPISLDDAGTTALELLRRSEPYGHDVLTIDAAIERLAHEDQRKATVVRLRFYGGLTHDEIAQHLGVTGRTVTNDWIVARAWLRRELADGAT
jgi:RNA polymerase sigma-70 factor, ECF subfamily